MSFRKFADNNIVVFDGAMGTSIQKVNIPDSVWQGKNGCNEFLNIASPETIYNIHKNYFDAGANVAVTNTFGAIASVLAEYGLEDKVVEINKAGVRLAREASNGKENTFVSLSMGPGTKLASLGHTTYESLYNQYLQQAECVDVDLYNIETAQDIIQLKAAVNACVEANRRKGQNTPILVSFTVENTYTLLTGSDISAVSAVMNGLPIYALGLNCAMGPDMLEPALDKLSKIWNGKIYISPNAGMPETVDGKTVYPMDAVKFTNIMNNLLDKYPLSMVGGCCGTDNSHIKLLAETSKGKKLPPQNNIAYNGEASSLFTAVSLEQNPKPAIIGERANATGSKAFRDLLLSDDYDGMVQVCKTQEEDGAHFIDLSTAYAGRNEIDDYKKIVPLLNSALTAPLVIDSTDPKTVKASLELYSGKPIINSINFEDGGKKLHEMLEIVKQHPACMVALTIDESGMAQTADKKFEVAKRLYDVWTNDYGFPPEDLIIDTLTFSIGSGDETLVNAGVETLNAIKRIKQELKGVKTTLGVSNVSFGLSPASRPILNSVFLHEAVKAGLDTAIVHASKLTHISNLSKKDIDCCLNLIYAKENALPEFIEHFINAKDQTYMRVMQIYCNQLGVAVDSDEKVNECIDTALAGKEKFSDIAVYVNSESILPVNTDNMTYEEYLQAIGIGTDMSSLEEDVKEEYDLSQIGADAKINIVGGDIFDDIVTGMFYAMNKYGNTYQLEPISEYAVDEENKSSMVLKTNNYDLFIGGMKSNIGVNWLKLSDIALDFNMVKNKDIVVFLSSDKNIQFAKLMAGSLKEKKKKAYVVNLKGNYQIELQNILTDKGDYRYTIVIMCNEKDLAKIVPVTKFWKLGRGHEILAITDLVGDIELTDEGKKYLQGIYILTGANLNENKNYNVISEEYKNDNKMPMTSKSALGFDIISYINSILNPEKEVKYVTNIKGIVNGYAVRNPVLLYVGEKGYIKKQEYDVPLIPEVEGDNSTDNMTDNKSTTLNKGE